MNKEETLKAIEEEMKDLNEFETKINGVKWSVTNNYDEMEDNDFQDDDGEPLPPEEFPEYETISFFWGDELNYRHASDISDATLSAILEELKKEKGGIE